MRKIWELTRSDFQETLGMENSQVQMAMYSMLSFLEEGKFKKTDIYLLICTPHQTQRHTHEE